MRSADSASLRSRNSPSSRVKMSFVTCRRQPPSAAVSQRQPTSATVSRIRGAGRPARRSAARRPGGHSARSATRRSDLIRSDIIRSDLQQNARPGGPSAQRATRMRSDTIRFAAPPRYCVCPSARSTAESNAKIRSEPIRYDRPHRGDVVRVPQRTAQLQHQRRLARAHRTADAHGKAGGCRKPDRIRLHQIASEDACSLPVPTVKLAIAASRTESDCISGSCPIVSGRFRFQIESDRIM